MKTAQYNAIRTAAAVVRAEQWEAEARAALAGAGADVTSPRHIGLTTEVARAARNIVVARREVDLAARTLARLQTDF